MSPRVRQLDDLVIPHNDRAEEAMRLFLATGNAQGHHDLGAAQKSMSIERFRTEYGRSLRGGMDPEYPPWNPRTGCFKKSRVLPTHEEGVVSGEELNRLIGRLHQKLDRIASITGDPPILLMDFYDDSNVNGCFTTSMLKETLVEIMGLRYQEWVTDLRANLRSKNSPMKGNETRFLTRFKEITNQGKIILSGGTFSDADDIHGLWFQENIMSEIIGNSQIYALVECWSYQVMLRALAKRYGLDIYIINGALKWGVFPIEMARRGPLTRVLSRGVRHTVSCAATHSDHAVVFGQRVKRAGDKIMFWDQENEEMAHLTIVAMDPLTGEPYGYLTQDERILGLATHPEVHLTTGNQLRQIQDYIEEKLQAFFAKRYGDIDYTNIRNNFNPRSTPRGPGLVGRELGPAFFAGTLEHFADGRLNDLKKGKR